MAALDPRVVKNIAAEYTGKKAFTQADKATQQLSKSVKNLAKGFGLIFGVQAAKQAVRAFAADDKAARTLSKTLDNLGLAFADPATKVFIADLERQYAVLDDLLRPAFQKLITTTGNFNKSQDLLKTALDLSAMSGIDVVTVAGDLSRAYAGNTRGILKYGLGITKAELATMDFDEILTRVAKVSSGQAQLAADSLQGSIAKLSVASANAAESLGKDLIQALTTLGGAGGLPKTLGLIESVASAIGDAIVGLSRLIQLVIIFGSGNPLESIKDAAAFRKLFEAQDAAQRMAERGSGGFSSYNAKKAADALALKSAKALAAEAKKAAAAELAKTKAKKDQAALDRAALALAKASDIFDMDAIQLNAAMLSSTQALGKATSQTQLLSIANDLVRLTIKQDMLVLEDAIAAKDVEGATAAAKKLNTDIAILGTLSGQSLKLANIKTIIESILPKSLIDLANLDAAIAKIIEMNRLQGTKTLVPANTPNAVIPTVITPTVTPTATAATGGKLGTITQAETTILLQTALGTDALFEYWEAATAAANAAADLLDYQNAQNEAAFKASSLFNAGATVNISAGVIASPDEFARMVQKAVQNANRFGNNLDYAGGL